MKTEISFVPTEKTVYGTCKQMLGRDESQSYASLRINEQQSDPSSYIHTSSSSSAFQAFL